MGDILEAKALLERLVVAETVVVFLFVVRHGVEQQRVGGKLERGGEDSRLLASWKLL